MTGRKEEIVNSTWIILIIFTGGGWQLHWFLLLAFLISTVIQLGTIWQYWAELGFNNKNCTKFSKTLSLTALNYYYISTVVQSDSTALSISTLNYILSQIYRKLNFSALNWAPPHTIMWRRRGKYFVVPRDKAGAIWRIWRLHFVISKMKMSSSNKLRKFRQACSSHCNMDSRIGGRQCYLKRAEGTYNVGVYVRMQPGWATPSKSKLACRYVDKT